MPDQSREDPLGRRGRELHGWHVGDPRATGADKMATEWLMRPWGAYVMGRNMFGPIRGDWDEDWSGWWGPEPPYHAPVFVLTHHRHDLIEMEGGRTFHLVTEGFNAAYSAACEAAGGGQVNIVGGASTVRQGNGRRASGYITWELRMDVPPFDDVRVRQAIKLIANRPQMVEQGYDGLGIPGDDLIGDWWDPLYDHSIPQHVQDIERAKALLKAAAGR